MHGSIEKNQNILKLEYFLKNIYLKLSNIPEIIANNYDKL